MNDCKIREWLLTEIRITKNRIKEYAECFDGVPVDNKTRNGGYTKLYVNGKWQRKVTNLDFHGYVGDNGIVIECEYEKLKCDKCGCPIVADNELVKEKRIVRI